MKTLLAILLLITQSAKAQKQDLDMSHWQLFGKPITFTIPVYPKVPEKTDTPKADDILLRGWTWGIGAGVEIADTSRAMSYSRVKADNKGIDHLEVSAGSDKMINSGQKMIVSGMAYSFDGDSVKYEWAQVAGPKATIKNPTSPKTQVFYKIGKDDGQYYTFQLTVTDGKGNKRVALTHVTVYNNGNRHHYKYGGIDWDSTITYNKYVKTTSYEIEEEDYNYSKKEHKKRTRDRYAKTNTNLWLARFLFAATKDSTFAGSYLIEALTKKQATQIAIKHIRNWPLLKIVKITENELTLTRLFDNPIMTE